METRFTSPTHGVAGVYHLGGVVDLVSKEETKSSFFSLFHHLMTCHISKKRIINTFRLYVKSGVRLLLFTISWVRDD
jgi:hypothetical protein